MKRLGLAVLLLAGCSSSRPEAWLLYARGNYLYGRVEALAEVACRAPTEKLKPVCAEAARVQAEVKTINPVIQAELAKDKPDWGRIFQYVDLVIGVAGKFLAVP